MGRAHVGYDEVGNLLLSRIIGADVRLSDAGFDIGFHPRWEDAVAVGALIDLVRDGRIAPGSNVLYAHLGRQPALNAYASAF